MLVKGMKFTHLEWFMVNVKNIKLGRVVKIILFHWSFFGFHLSPKHGRCSNWMRLFIFGYAPTIKVSKIGSSTTTNYSTHLNFKAHKIRGLSITSSTLTS